MLPVGNQSRREPLRAQNLLFHGSNSMGRGILLWLLGVPIPVIILILLFWN
jgi:hypothetical protein